MSNLRFYHPESLQLGSTVKLSTNAAAHATRVLRLNAGDTLALFNGDGLDYDCELISVKKSEVLAKVNSSTALNNESPLQITLLQGISSGDRMDFTIQKAVELGVTKIVPIKTARSLVKLNGNRAEKRLEHWKNIIISACEQSGRAVVPEIIAPISLSSWLSANSQEKQLRITLDPIAATSMNKLDKPSDTIELLIGAEGGLTDEELKLAHQHSFTGVQLGKRILRTETAALAAITAMQTLWGDFN